MVVPSLPCSISRRSSINRIRCSLCDRHTHTRANGLGTKVDEETQRMKWILHSSLRLRVIDNFSISIPMNFVVDSSRAHSRTRHRQINWKLNLTIFSSMFCTWTEVDWFWNFSDIARAHRIDTNNRYSDWLQCRRAIHGPRHCRRHFSSKFVRWLGTSYVCIALTRWHLYAIHANAGEIKLKLNTNTKQKQKNDLGHRLIANI